MRGAMQGWKRVRVAGPGAAVSTLALTLALALLAPPALAAAPLPEKLGDCVDYKASGDGTVLFNRCNVDLTVRYCCTGAKAGQHWRCTGGRAARKGAHQWLPATAQGRLPQTWPMACDARAGWRRAACAVQDGAFGATLGPYNWNGGQPDPGMRCTDPQTAGTPAEDAAKKSAAPADTAKKGVAKEARAAARPAPQEAAKPAAKPARQPAAQPNLALQNPLWIQQWLARLGFDPGPLDGVAGARTRAALRLWQAARGYPATGVLTAEQALVLGGLKPAPNAASGTTSNTAPAGQTAGRTAPKENQDETPKTTAEPPTPPTAFTPKCFSKGREPREQCWAEVPGRAGCHVWKEMRVWSFIPEGHMTGPCPGGLAHGRWIWRYMSGTALKRSLSYEGVFVNGKHHGRWIRWHRRERAYIYYEIPYVNGKLHGRLTGRMSGKTSAMESDFVNGKKHGQQVWRYKDGSRKVCQFSHGKELGCQNYKR